jgi:drug/metabolite transporter (DMT)-like permease
MTTWLHIEPLLAVILWGGVYPGAKLGLREIPVLRFTALRILVAMVMLFIVSGSVPALYLPRSLWHPLLKAGLAQTVFQLLLVAGLRWTTAGNSAILLATAPLLTAGWLAATGRASLGSRQWSGVVVGLVGVGFVVQGGGLGVTWAELGGDLLALGAAGAWAWYGLVIGPLVGTLGAIRATGWTMAVAACGFSPLALIEEWVHTWRSVSWEAWAGLLYGATVGMVGHGPLGKGDPSLRSATDDAVCLSGACVRSGHRCSVAGGSAVSHASSRCAAHVCWGRPGVRPVAGGQGGEG